MNPVNDSVEILCSTLFRLAVMRLVEGEAFIEHQHLLDVIPPAQQLAFLALLEAGTGLRACFAELDAFLAWQTAMQPVFEQYGMSLDLPYDQVTLYLLDKAHQPNWQFSIQL